MRLTTSLKATPGVLISIVLLSPLFNTTSAAIRHIEDKDVTVAVERSLQADPVVSHHDIDVVTEDGLVTLSGSVNHLLAKERAAQIARSIKGVRSVLDTLTVQTEPLSDRETEKKIVMILETDPLTEDAKIDVSVSAGNVILSGTVHSQAEQDAVRRIAAGVKGVKAIESRLELDREEARSDEQLRSEISRRLESDALLHDEPVTVAVKDGVVTLGGSVTSALEKKRASDLSRIAGVVHVDAGQLEVDLTHNDAIKEAKTPPTDEEITRAVEAALLQDPRVLSFKPVVSVEDGVVTLTGSVGNLKAKRAAEADARNTFGVRRVKNYLKVRPRSFAADASIAKRVKAALSLDPILYQASIAIDVLNGRVFLRGKVDSRFERRHAEELVSRVLGVVDVANRLTVTPVWTSKSDHELKEDVLVNLSWNPLVDEDDILVRVEDGVVLLMGRVASVSEQDAAKASASLAGAKRVVDKLQIAIDEK